jgi:hypothetical protein
VEEDIGHDGTVVSFHVGRELSLILPMKPPPQLVAEMEVNG